LALAERRRASPTARRYVPGVSDDQPPERDPTLERLEKLERPLRSEEAMFRVFMFVGLAALPIIAAGLIIGPLAGAIVLLFEIGVAIGVGLSRRRSRS
jgi:hypothetical protein